MNNSFLWHTVHHSASWVNGICKGRVFMKLPTGSVGLWYVPSRPPRNCSLTQTDSHKGGKVGITAAPGKRAHRAGPSAGCTAAMRGPNYERVRNGMHGIIRSQTAVDMQHNCCQLFVFRSFVCWWCMYNSIQHKGLALHFWKKGVDQVLVTLVCKILTYCI